MNGGARNLKDSLVKLNSSINYNPQLSEGDIYSNLVNTGFFQSLGYEHFGKDIRTQSNVKGFEPDYYCVDDMERTVFVLEAKKPSEENKIPITSYKNKQLRDKYVVPLEASFGILTNGIKFIFYERVGNELLERKHILNLAEIKDQDVEYLYARINKPVIDFRKADELLNEIREPSVKPKLLSTPQGRQDFYLVFKLAQNSKFGDLTRSLMELLDYCIERKYRFTSGAFNFWSKSYALQLDEVPKPWKDMTTKELLPKFMFCLETAHALVSRLILSKVAEDAEVPDVGVIDKMKPLISEYSYRGVLSLLAYPIAIKETLTSLQERLVESVFEEDLFNWWEDPFRDKLVSDKTGKEMLQYNDIVLENFGNNLIRLVSSLYAFKFNNLEDIIGDLYQEYFDRETRKALGEFYTPVPVVEYILDSVGYNGIINKRLLDPACGSGTFIVQALKRYLLFARREIRNHPKRHWGSILDELCNRPKIVGFDINPFAVLMSQIRFMIELIPYYKKAIEHNPDFTLKTLPIFMTDSIWSEKGKAGKTDFNLDKQSQITSFVTSGKDIIFSVELPLELETKKSKFVKISIAVPDRTALSIKNADQHFNLLRILFSRIKEESRAGNYKTAENFEEELIRELSEIDTELDFHAISTKLRPYADTILETIKTLKEKYEDGRLIKSMEDRVLAGILKNYISFDYVVGNPPWVSKQTKKTFLTDQYQTELKTSYVSANADFDLYVPFIEKSLNSLVVGGKLGFIISNTFLKNSYGEAIRAILTQNMIKEVVDFLDYDVFEDPTNYSSIIVVEKTQSELYRRYIENNIEPVKCTRIAFWPEEQIEELMLSIRDGKKSDNFQIFYLPYSEFNDKIPTYVNEKDSKLPIWEKSVTLNYGKHSLKKKSFPISDIWIISPKEELDVLYNLEKVSNKRLGPCEQIRGGKVTTFSGNNIVSDKIFVGLQLDGKSALVVRPKENMSIEKILKESLVTVTPKGIPDYTLQFETKLLRFLIDGKDIGRWYSPWDSDLVIFPYELKGDEFELVTPMELKKNENAHNYLSNPITIDLLYKSSADRKKLFESLKQQFGVTNNDELSKKLKDPLEVERLPKELWWYRYIYRKNLESVDKPKIMVSTTSIETRFSADFEGHLAPHNVRVYSIIIPKEELVFILALLNSKLITFYLRHFAIVKKGKTFEFIKQVLCNVPIKSDTKWVTQIVKTSRRLIGIKKLEAKIQSFPDSYISKYADQEFDDFEVNIKHKLTDHVINVQSDISATQYSLILNGKSFVRSHVLSSMIKARYLIKCLVIKSGKRTGMVTVSVPRDDKSCVKLMDELKKDLSRLSSEKVGELENGIDKLIFKIYNIDSDQQLVINEFLHKFSNEFMKEKEKEQKKHLNSISVPAFKT